MRNQLFRLTNVSVRRGSAWILKDISLTIRLGEHVALIGPNGSGKSTLIKVLTRELYPSRGEIRLLGQTGWDIFELRQQLGIVSDDWQTSTMRDVSGRGVPGLEVVLSGYFSSVGVWKAVTPSMEKKARSLLKNLGVSHLADRPMTHASAGEARRVLIARALVHSPQALLLDEPTNSLDFAAAKSFRKTLLRLADSKHGLILVTHRAEDLIPAIRRTILLKQGRVVADGPTSKLMKPEILERLYGSAVRIIHEKGYYTLY